MIRFSQSAAWLRAACLAAAFFTAASAAADAPAPPVLGYLQWLQDELAFATAAAESPEAETQEPAWRVPQPPEVPLWVSWLGYRLGLDQPDRSAEASEIAALRNEISEMRAGLRELQDTLDFYLGAVLADIEAENQALRGEVRRLHALAGGDARTPAVPRPGSEIIDALLDEMAAEIPLSELPPDAVPGARAEADADPDRAPAEFTFTVVAEWGRTPEQVRELPQSVPSLKGMVGLVPRGSADEDLAALGRDLRAQFAAYDNINIEVFDDEEAAESFAERSVSSKPERRVLSVSKHRATGRDVILLVREDGSAEEAAAF